MYLSGTVINMSYVNDPKHEAVIKSNSVGLTVLNISYIKGGQVTKKGIHSSKYMPLPVRVTDTQDRFYDLGEGAYQVVFSQGLNKLPKDAIATLENNNTTQQTGISFLGDRYFEYSMKGNLSGILIVPSNCGVSIEVGSNIADLFIKYEKVMEEV